MDTTNTPPDEPISIINSEGRSMSISADSPSMLLYTTQRMIECGIWQTEACDQERLDRWIDARLAHDHDTAVKQHPDKIVGVGVYGEYILNKDAELPHLVEMKRLTEQGDLYLSPAHKDLLEHSLTEAAAREHCLPRADLYSPPPGSRVIELVRERDRDRNRDERSR